MFRFVKNAVEHGRTLCYTGSGSKKKFMAKTARNNIKRYLGIIFALIFLSVNIPPPEARAFPKNLFDQIKKESDQPVIVKGDKVEYFREQKKVVGEGNVSITYRDAELKSDKITVYTDTKEAICEGNVKIIQPGASYSGNKINYNFDTKKGYALDSSLKAYVLGSGLKEAPFYGGAEKIEQRKDKDYKLDKGYITTCDLEEPHYKITAKEIQIFLGRKILAKHVIFYIGKVPVLYLPIYYQPIIEDWPEVTVVPGQSSEWGYYVLTAWRYYFNENSKGFIHFDYREKKGLATGADYKYDAGELGEGVLRFYYTHENDRFAFTDTGREDDRWRVQYRHMMSLPEDTYLMMELNKLSDEEIVKDYLYQEYKENEQPDNYLLLETRKPNYILSILARKRLNTFYAVVERLPEIKLSIYNQRLWNTNLYYTSENSVTNFVKRYDEYYQPPSMQDQKPDKAVRIDGYYKFSYAAKLLNFLYTTPFVATRQTFYSQNKWKTPSQFRSLYEVGVDMSTKFFRVFDIETNFLNLDLHKLRHIITPTASYLHRHQPTIAASNLYQFDGIDTIDKYNGFVLSLENKLQTKRKYRGELKTVDLARFIVSTDYTFRLKKKSLAFQGVGKFGDFKFKLELYPYSWLSIHSDVVTGLDSDRQPKKYKINTAYTDFNINFTDKFTLGIGHRYEGITLETSSQFTGQMLFNINDDWKIKVYQRFNVRDQKWEEQEYVIFKDLHCWEAQATYSIRNNTIDSENHNLEHTLWLAFRLKAFPEIPIGLVETSYQKPDPGRMEEIHGRRP